MAPKFWPIERHARKKNLFPQNNQADHRFLHSSLLFIFTKTLATELSSSTIVGHLSFFFSKKKNSATEFVKFQQPVSSSLILHHPNLFLSSLPNHKLQKQPRRKMRKPSKSSIKFSLLFLLKLLHVVCLWNQRFEWAESRKETDHFH